jgi:hypothetical protein
VGGTSLLPDRRDRTVAIVEVDLNTFRSTAGAIAILAAATTTGLAQPASQTPAGTAKAPVAPVTHPTIAPTSTVVAPARNAIGLPAPSPAAKNIGPVHGPGQGGPDVNAAKSGTFGVGIGSGAQHAPMATAKGTLSGSQMGRPVTGAAKLGGGATHAPNAVIGHNVSTKH